MTTRRIVLRLQPETSGQIHGRQKRDQSADSGREMCARRFYAPKDDRNRRSAGYDGEQMKRILEDTHPRTPSCTTAPPCVTAAAFRISSSISKASAPSLIIRPTKATRFLA